MNYGKIIINKMLWIHPAIFGLVYFVLAELGMFLSVKPHYYIIFFPASGVFVSVLILAEFRLWRYFIAAAFLANFLVDVHHSASVWVSFFLSAGSCIEAFCGAWLIRTCLPSSNAMNTLKDLLGLTIFSALLSTTISATIGAAAITYCFRVESFWTIWLIRWVAAGLGVLVTAPLVLTWFIPGGFGVKPFNWRRVPEALCMMFSILFCSWSIFSQNQSWINIDDYLLIPLLVWAALRFEFRGVSTSGFLMTIAASGLTSKGLENFSMSGVSTIQYILSVQVFIGIMLFTIQVLAAVLYERKQIELALQLSEKKYRILFDNAPDGIEMLDASGYIVECNPAFEKYVGYDRTDIIGRHTSDFFSEECSPIIKEKLKTACETGFSESELNLVSRDGEIIEIWKKSKTVFDDEHEIIGIVAYNRNISLRKKAERELSALLAAMPAYVLISRDPECRQIMGSRNVSELWGAESIAPPENSSAFKQLFPFISVFENEKSLPSLKIPLQLAAIQGTDLRDFELFIEFENGRRKTLLGNATPLKNKQNKVTGSVAVFLDISDRKEMEDALRESEERMKLALKGTDVGIWDWNVDQGTILFDDHWAKILGLDPQTKTADIDWLYKKMRDKGADDLQNAIRQYLQEQSPYFELEYQIQIESNEWKWIWTRGKAIEVGRQGKPKRVIGVLRDITERKRTEEIIKASLREKEILLREIHHRVKNNMQVISSLLKLQSSKVKDERVLSAIKESENRIRTMSLVHETLYRTDTFGTINFQSYLTSLAKSIYQSYVSSSKRLDIIVDADRIDICLEHASTLGLLINELLTNSFKYAFQDRSEGKILIQARLTQDNQMELIIKDDGIGFPKGLDWRNTDSLGLQLVITLAENQLDGSIELDTTSGTQFTIRFTYHDSQKGF